MKATRIFLFLSPLLLLVPPLLPLHKSLAWSMIGGFYGLLLRRFPWNLLMAFVCYSYAQQLGRDAFLWAGGSFFFPFLTPLILAFMSPKYGSVAFAHRSTKAAPVPAKGTKGTFEERFPLLERCLSGKPEATCLEQRARFAPVAANYEFSMSVDPSALERMPAEAAARNFTVWTNADETGRHLFGAGLVQPGGIDETAAWLRSASVPGEKITAVWRHPDGNLKFLEYYSA